VPVLKRPQAARGLAESPAGNAAIEAYRGLRYALSFVAPGEGAQVVLVTSAGPEEGKTTTALNLATTAVMSGRSVILVDSDLRQPTLHRLLGFDDGVGLSDVLAGKATVAEALRTVPESGLQVLTAGTAALNPVDLLESESMRQLLTSLRASAHLVVLDSPPLLSSADGLILAQLSDAVLVVCRPGKSHRRALQRARALLAQMGRRFSGVVLNQVRAAAGYDSYYASYYAKRGRARRQGSAADSTDQHA
jgi:capsular exopolysaccharide synthesis family protein